MVTVNVWCGHFHNGLRRSRKPYLAYVSPLRSYVAYFQSNFSQTTTPTYQLAIKAPRLASPSVKWPECHPLYRVIQNKRAKIKQDIGDAPLTQLTYHFTSYNSCSNWQPPTSMQKLHRRTRFCRTLDKYPWCVLNNWLHRPYRGCPTEQFEVGNWCPWSQYSKHARDICQGAAESCMPLSCLHWGWWPSIWATIVRCRMVR